MVGAEQGSADRPAAATAAGETIEQVLLRGREGGDGRGEQGRSDDDQNDQQRCREPEMAGSPPPTTLYPGGAG